jgi:SPP1 gp7 family putative phage head morphogenesis protein
MAKSSEYWRQRAEFLEDAKNRAAGRYTAEIEKQFNLARKTLDEQIEQWYGRFADNNGITLSEARKWLTGKDLAEFKWDVNEYIKHGKEAALNPAFVKQLENASARFHISRLEALKLKTQNTIEQLYNGVQAGSGSLFGKIYKDSYYHTAYELQKGFNIGFDVAALSDKHVESVLSKPWTLDKRTFSDRIWQQKNNLITEIHTRLTQNAILGTPPEEAIRAIAKRFNVSKHQAGRLVMTESAYFMNAAQIDAYKTLDVEEFEIIGTLDNRICPECGPLDGKHLPTSQFEPGVTAPPYHCFCRCCTAPYFSDNGGERFARDAEGKGYYVPADMKYTEWKAYNKAIADEPAITSDLKTIVSDVGANLAGLDGRLKSVESLLRKTQATGVPANQIHDIVRYTEIAEPDKYSDYFRETVAKLKQKGYTVIRVKNYWIDKSNPYQGVNVRLTSPAGQKFELQFHTQESFDLKDGELHKLYEQRRVIDDKKSAEAIEIDDRMFELSRQLRVPEGAEGIG